jgi:hypothetical protein
VRPLLTHRTTQTQNERTQTSISRAGFEPTTPVFERAKTIHALDRAATVFGPKYGLCTVNIPGIFLGTKGGRRVRLTILPPSVSRLSRENVEASTSCYGDSFTFTFTVNIPGGTRNKTCCVPKNSCRLLIPNARDVKWLH